jgi:hypothetical protein
MKRVGTLAACIAGGLVLNTSLHADDAVLPGNPYAVVVARNIFGLNPPPPVDPNAAKAPEPPVKVIPNGIMSIFGQLQVLFKVPAKPGGKDASYILTEGQSQDEIEVVKINEKAGTVTFNNHGIVQELPLVVTPPSSTPASTPTSGNPAITAPGMAPGGGPGRGAGNNPFTSRFGNRGGRNGNNPSGGNNSDGASDGAGLRSVPSRGGTSGQQTPMTGEEAMIMTAANKLKAFQENSPAAPIFPPTPLDEPAGVPSNLAPAPPAPGGSASH